MKNIELVDALGNKQSYQLFYFCVLPKNIGIGEIRCSLLSPET